MINYGGLEEQYSQLDNAKIVIQPVPYDGTSTWIKGADKGPEALLEASANMELYDIETDSEPYLHGIYTAEPVTEAESPESMTRAVYESTKKFLDQDKFVITLGGEHSVSTGAIQAHFEKFDNVSVLQLDAHTDLRPEYEGSKFNHACVMSRVSEMGSFVQVGIRSMDAAEREFIHKDRIFFAENIQNDNQWMHKVSEQLTENVYITLDLDVFDPSIMPSTGTPEPGGLLWYPVLELMRKISQKHNVVGFDVVELCPNPENQGPDFLAAKLVYKMLNYRFNK